MKKHLFMATALLAAAASYGQQKEPPPVKPVPSVDAPPSPRLPNRPDELPPPPPPKVEVSLSEELPADYRAFLARNKEVKSIGWMHNNRVAIYLKGGKKEVYDLNDEASAQKLKSKYGSLPEAPPPPPPPPAPKKRSVRT